jgi:hypothetical protein
VGEQVGLERLFGRLLCVEADCVEGYLGIEGRLYGGQVAVGLA